MNITILKTIFQKHTSKFVANLLNGLGIIACLSLTACGNEKGNNDGDNNEVENLKSALKNKFGNLNDSEFEKISKALKVQGKSIDDVNNMSADQLKDFLNLPGNENVKNLASKVTKKMRGRIPKILSKLKMEKFIWMVSPMI